MEFDTNPFRAISLDVAAIIFNTKFGKYFSPFFFVSIKTCIKREIRLLTECLAPVFFKVAPRGEELAVVPLLFFAVTSSRRARWKPLVGDIYNAERESERVLVFV